MAALFMSHGAIDGPQARQCQAAGHLRSNAFYPRLFGDVTPWQHQHHMLACQRLAERFQSILNGVAIPIFTIPPAIVVHTGPGLITASAFIAEDGPAAPSA